MKTKILILFLALAPLMMEAQVNYAVSGNTAYVTNSPNASGNVVIASTYNGYPVTSIEDYAFEGSPGLTSVTIPNSVTSIGDYALAFCYGLTNVTIGNSVTNIGDDAFEGSALTSVTIPNSVINIGEGAFASCQGLASVMIGNSVTNIGEEAFEECPRLTNIAVNAANPNYAGLGGALFDKSLDTLLQFPGGLAGSYAIPDSVTSIGVRAFVGCSGLTNVTIPDSVTNIGDYAFVDCNGLTGVTIPNSVTSIGEGAFQDCPRLTSVTIPDSVTSIGGDAFLFCDGLTSVTIGNSVTSIGNDAFEDCASLTSVTIPNSVTNIGDLAFASLGLTNIAVNAANPYYAGVGGVLFNKSLDTLLQFPGGLAGSYAIPNSVTNIGDAFEGCGLTSVTIPNSVTSIGENAFGGSLLTSVIIPNSVTSIGKGAFASCYGLMSVTIPNSVTSIGENAFSVCYGLTSVTIGNSVTNIDEDAFAFCYGLTNITFSGNAPLVHGVAGSADSTVFQGDSGTVYYYAGTSGWGSNYGGLPTVELFAPQIGGGGIGIQSGNFGFTVTGASGQTVIVEASTNLVNWQPIWTNTLSGTSTNFFDSQWTNFPRRFYRAARAYTVGGTLTGLPAGDTVTLQNNGSDNLTLSANGPFTFPTALPDGQSYSVTYIATTSRFGAYTFFTNGSGAISGANVTNVAVTFTPVYTGNPDGDMLNAAVADGTDHGGVAGVMYTENGGPFLVTAIGENTHSVALIYNGWARFATIVAPGSCSSTTFPVGTHVIQFGTVVGCGAGYDHYYGY